MSKALTKAGCFEEIILHTGQHYDYLLSGAFFNELEIPVPKYNLEIGSGRQAWQLGRMITGIDAIIEKENPDVIIVFGDTNSTAAGAIAGAKNNIPVAHVEAGLREFNKTIPEEVNKLLTTASADLYFCPTPTGVRNLAKIGITENVHLVGDVGIDLIAPMLKDLDEQMMEIGGIKLYPKKYYFFSCHRASNTDNANNLEEILSVLKELPQKVVFSVHPRIEKAMIQQGLVKYTKAKNIILLKPFGFFETQLLIHQAKAVITDSGGIIKEAYFHKTPGIIIDRQTEWIETLQEGWNHIAGPNREQILQLVKTIKPPKTHTNCLGDGTASIKVASILKNYLDARR